MKIKLGVNKWDSWGMGFSFCSYDRSFNFSFIHWVFYVDIWTAKEVTRHNENMRKLKNLMAAGDLDD